MPTRVGHEAAVDLTEALVMRVRAAHANGTALCIQGSGSKAFLAARPLGLELETLDVTGHAGVIDYRPEELVVTARAGTPLLALEALLAQSGQYLPFEPPRFGGGGTVGGAVAVGLSGPGRPWWGALRDAVLGVELVNGFGEHLRFGGQVMKNVAGFDLSRLQVGAFGTLGLLLSVSLKVLPRPPAVCTRVFELTADEAIARCRAWALQPLPLSAACYTQGLLRIRLAGAEPAVADAATRLGGMPDLAGDAEEPDFWSRLRDGAIPGCATPGLWRVTVPPAAALSVPLLSDRMRSDAQRSGMTLINWAGAERWFALPDQAAGQDGGHQAQTEIGIEIGSKTASEAGAALMRAAAAAGGNARAFAGDYSRSVASAATARYAARVRDAFDPTRVLNPHLGVQRAH